MTADALVEPGGVVSPSTVDEIENALRTEPPASTPDATGRLARIRHALRRP